MRINNLNIQNNYSLFQTDKTDSADFGQLVAAASPREEFLKKLPSRVNEEELKNIFESMGAHSAFSMNGPTSLMFQANQISETAIVTANYILEPIEGQPNIFSIKDKITGESYGEFDLLDTTVRMDKATGKSYLIQSSEKYITSAVTLNDELEQGLRQYLGVDSLGKGFRDDGYEIYTDPKSGIESFQKWDGQGVHLSVFVSNQPYQEYLENLGEQYLKDYPNLVVPENALWYAELEVAGLQSRTPNGIISIGQDSISYDDNHDPKKSWLIITELSKETNATLRDMALNHFAGDLSSENLEAWLDQMDEMGVKYEELRLHPENWKQDELEKLLEKLAEDREESLKVVFLS